MWIVEHLGPVRLIVVGISARLRARGASFAAPADGLEDREATPRPPNVDHLHDDECVRGGNDSLKKSPAWSLSRSLVAPAASWITFGRSNSTPRAEWWASSSA